MVLGSKTLDVLTRKQRSTLGQKIACFAEGVWMLFQQSLDP